LFKEPNNSSDVRDDKKGKKKLIAHGTPICPPFPRAAKKKPKRETWHKAAKKEQAKRRGKSEREIRIQSLSRGSWGEWAIKTGERNAPPTKRGEARQKLLPLYRSP